MSEILEVPNSWKAGIITKKGLGLLSKLVKGNTLSITRAETGAGFVDHALLPDLAAVMEPMQALTFSTVSYPEEGKCVVPCKLTNEEITDSYIARQIGLYAMDPDEGEILFYITQVEKEDGGTGIPSTSLIPSYSSTWNLVIYYGMADGVDVTVDPAGTVSLEDLEEAIDGAKKEVANSVGSAIIRDITIPKDGWQPVGENAEDDYIYTVDVLLADALDTHFPTMALDIVSLKPAAEAGMCPTIDALDGIVRFWARTIPTVDLTGSIMLRSENLITIEDIGNGLTDDDIATDEEVSDAVEDVFGDATEDDDSDEGNEENQDNIATDKEVEDMLTDVFG